MNVYELEQKLNRQKNKIGLAGGKLKIHENSEAQEPISAHINPGDWHIEITLKENYNPVRDKKTQKYVSKRNMTNPLEKICEDILYHECGHWELPRGTGNGCPYDELQHDLITESISKLLRKHGKESFTSHVANAFEDVLDNTNCKQYTNHAGQILFWNEQGMTHGNYTPFYETFVRLNLALWGEHIDNMFLKRWYSGKKEAMQALKEVLASWNLPKTRGTQGVQKRVAHLYQKETWAERAEQFAEAMLPLLEEPQPHLMFGSSTQGTSQSGAEGSAFDKKLASPEGQEKTAFARYTAGKGPAMNRDSFEQLDALYRKLARNIPIQIETFTKAYSFPLVPYGKEPFDPETHDLLVRKSKLALQDNGMVGLDVNKGWIDTNETYKQNISKFPRFRLAVLDTSESMKQAPDSSDNTGSAAFIPWGDNSKYHYALLGYYGIERFLQSQHIAPYVDSGAINFSAETIGATGENARKLLLKPQFGGTRLDVNTLREHVQDENTFLLSISDGDIQNWNSVKNEYKNIVTKCASAHIQIGEKNQFSKDLERWNIPVYHVHGSDDLTRLMVTVASDKYKAHGRAAQ